MKTSDKTNGLHQSRYSLALKGLRIKDSSISHVFESLLKYHSTDRIFFCPTLSSTSTARHNADYYRHQLQKREDF